MSKIKHSYKLSIIASLLLSSTIFAAPADDARARAPYRIKPNTPAFAPSGLAPATVAHVYGFDAIPNQGEGTTIAIVDAYDNPNAEQDLAVFSNTFNLPPCTTANGCFKKVYASGTPPIGDPGWGVEIALDIQWAHAIAPKAKIILIETADNYLTNLYQGVRVALQYNPAVVSMSWGSLENSSTQSYGSIFNVSGVEFTAASMDSGHGVYYPAAFPKVIGVGGTTLKTNANSYSEVAWSGSGGGISAIEPEPTYQLNYSLPNNPNKMRGVPDVAYIGDPNTGFSVYDTYGYAGWMVIGGTSAGAPQWASLIAIAKSATNTKLVDILPNLYNIAKTNYSGNFNDIITGSNGPCGSICNASTGYDYVTGLGSPKATSLIPAIIGQPTATVVTVSPSSVSLSTGQTQQFSATVINNPNTSVTWSASGGAITPTGLYTAPFNAGNYVVTATSVASPTAKGTANVTVNDNPPPTTNLALNKRTIASTQFSSAYSPPKATDADPINTRWCAINGTNGQWLMVDLGATYALSSTKLKWESNGVWQYKIEVSNNGSSWQLAVDRTANTETPQNSYYTDNFSASGRYVRITATKNQTGHWASIFDFQVFGQ